MPPLPPPHPPHLQAHISSFLEGGTSAEEVAGAAGTPQEVQLLQVGGSSTTSSRHHLVAYTAALAPPAAAHYAAVAFLYRDLAQHTSSTSLSIQPISPSCAQHSPLTPPPCPAALLQEVQQFLLSGPQAPAMRTSYRRMAFQQHDSNAVRVSLDTEVVMVGGRQGLGVWRCGGAAGLQCWLLANPV